MGNEQRQRENENKNEKENGNEFTDRVRVKLSFVPIFHIPIPFGLSSFLVSSTFQQLN